MRRLWIALLVLPLLLAGCSSSSSGGEDALRSQHNLGGKDAAEIIDYLDRLGESDRPSDLMASVRPEQLLLSDGKAELALDLPADRFYVSIAPYVDSTHDCFYHSLTTCQGELTGEEVQVTVVDGATGEKLVDEQMTTFDNGFVGLWLPRGIGGTIAVSHDGMTGAVEFSTREDSPTCLTTLQLA